eukprot:TRINITY_DN2930_c0_g1_i1.p1 TRINITY_DN2930_c0_g1~~TRINITY_DN2930_c0_g1_i1.p1  ORF type:complete len:300 (+),score=76.75 TRINITY_DN2930_c0_g1_i1:1058-1957(+)
METSSSITAVAVTPSPTERVPVPPADVLVGRVDRYRGFTILGESLPVETGQFTDAFKASIEWWKLVGIRLVWLHIPLSLSHYIAIAAEAEFKYHHAKPEYVVMSKWLSEEENKMPLDTHTSLGVGGFVLNDKNQVLAVREKNWGPNAPWKLPGGMVDPKEDLVAAAIREVLEETNIQTKFHSVISFRHTHRSLFGTSNIYFVCKLVPLTEEITKEDAELLDAQWMDVHDYIEEVTGINKLFAQVAIGQTPQAPSSHHPGVVVETPQLEPSLTSLSAESHFFKPHMYPSWDGKAKELTYY